MPTINHTDEITSGITWGRAASAVAVEILRRHELFEDTSMFNEEEGFQTLMRRCRFLPSAMTEGIPVDHRKYPEETIGQIVDFIYSDLSDENLIELGQTVVAIAAGHNNSSQKLQDILERIQLGVEEIDAHDDPEERAQANQRARTSIESAVMALYPVSGLLSAIRTQNSQIDSWRIEDMRTQTNQSVKERITEALGDLAVTLRQERWAKANGFDVPSDH